MNTKAWVILVAASVTAATTLLVLLRRAPWGDRFKEVPDLITECYDRIREIEQELQHLQPSAQQAA